MKLDLMFIFFFRQGFSYKSGVFLCFRISLLYSSSVFLCFRITLLCSSGVALIVTTPMYMHIGIEIYCAPSADSGDTWVSTMTHVAMEGGCYVLSPIQFCRRKDYPSPPEYLYSPSEEFVTPDSDSIIWAGGSVIISPHGEILAGPNYEGEGLFTADLGMPIPLTSIQLHIKNI